MRNPVISAESSLYEFLKQAWPIIEGNQPFIDSWHIETIAEHLEAVYRREIKKLIINVPPRSSKTTLVSIAFPAWVWLHNPSERFLAVSCVNSLSLEHAQKSRNLIESDWYVNNWCNPKSERFKFTLAKDQNAKSFFQNSQSGYRQATSISSKLVGKGFSIGIFDDPNDPGDYSDVKRQNVINWWTQKMSTRANNPETDARIVIQQRTHENDLTGYILKNDPKDEWVKLILPMEFESARRAKTIQLKNWSPYKDKIWEDPRQKEGSLLIPDRMGVKVVLELRKTLGSYGYAGQCQQRPSPLIGGILQKKWFKKWKGEAQPKFEYIFQSWDTAFSDKPEAAYSACTTWGVFYNEEVANILLLSVWRGRVGFPELKARAIRLIKDYKDVTAKPNVLRAMHSIDRCIIEAKATGDPLIRELQLAGLPATPYQPRGDKHARVQMVSPYIEAGCVWLPTLATNNEVLIPWAEEFLEIVATFPNSDSRDYVDTLTQILGYLRDNNLMRDPRNPKQTIAENKNIIPYFNN